MIPPIWLAILYFGSEVFISTRLRSKTAGSSDQGSLRMIWIVVNASVASAMLAKYFFPAADWVLSKPVYWLGFVVFAAALALRWYSIAYLGRYFTVNVTVQTDQKVVDTGPYRWVRHPSYTGSLLAFYGLGLCLGNYATLVLLSVPTTIVFLHRMKIEEAALLNGLGAAYREYMARTKRLVPFLY